MQRFTLYELSTKGEAIVSPGLTVARLIDSGDLAPAARDMRPADIMHQYNETNAGETWLVEDDAPAPWIARRDPHPLRDHNEHRAAKLTDAVLANVVRTFASAGPANRPWLEACQREQAYRESDAPAAFFVADEREARQWLEAGQVDRIEEANR